MKVGKKKAKSVKAWALKPPKGSILVSSVSSSRQGVRFNAAQTMALDDYNECLLLVRSLRYKIVRVEIREVKGNG